MLIIFLFAKKSKESEDSKHSNNKYLMPKGLNSTKKIKSSSGYNWFYLLFATIITVALLWWALRDVSPRLVVKYLRNSQVSWLCLGLITFLASYLVRAKRWGTLLGINRNPIPFHIRLSAIFIGFASNCILPGRAGELVRAVVIKRFSNISLGTALGSIFTARLLDALVAFILLLISLLVIVQSGHAELINIPLEGIAFFLGLVCLAFLIAAWYPRMITSCTGKFIDLIGLSRWRTKIIGVINSILQGLEALRYPRRGITALIETFLIWVLMGELFWLGAIAFSITSPGIFGALLVQSIVALAVALPSSPGYIGPFEAGVRFGLEIYDLPPDVIMAYAITIHFLMNLSITIIGLLFAASLGLSWQDFVKDRHS